MRNLYLLLMLSSVIFFNSCQTEKIDDTITNPPIPSTTTKKAPCGQIKEINLMAGQNYLAGKVNISNDATNIYVTYTTTDGWNINKTHLYVGNCNLIPLTNAGNPKIGQFPNQTTHSPAVTTFTYTIPLANMPDCVCILSHAEVFKNNGTTVQTETAWGEGDQLSGSSWAMKYNYCIQKCDDCVINSGDFRTQTQGGWGSTPNGNNPGSYLHSHFAGAFPSGLTVGCTTYTLTLTTANAVTTFLPQGGQPKKLTKSYTDPTTLNNVLAGQIVALTISVKFDETFPDFGNSSTHLGDLIIANGTFQGWTVNQVLAEANLVFGGCSTKFTPAQINEILSSINENFVDGTHVGTILVCPNGDEISKK